MTGLIGEYDCKVDAKGRFMFPINLKKQLAETFEKGFVINRNLHNKCLTVYPVDEWTKLRRAQYADGGCFAQQETYGEFLRSLPDAADSRAEDFQSIVWI